jgi:hypothetical protein
MNVHDLKTDVDLSAEEARRWLADQRRAAFGRLAAAVSEFESLLASGRVHATLIDGVERWTQCERVETAYRQLRALYVTHRARSGWVPNPEHVTNPDAPRAVPDPTALDLWTAQRAVFLDCFFGRSRGGKRSFDGVLPAIADVMARYQHLQSRWHQRSPEYKAWKRKYQKTYMANRRAKAKAAKEASHAGSV